MKKWGFLKLLLILLVILSSLSVIYLSDLNRRLAITLEASFLAQNHLRLEWDKLLLEESTWAAQARVQALAIQNLHMEVPTSDKMVIVQLK